MATGTGECHEPNSPSQCPRRCYLRPARDRRWGGLVGDEAPLAASSVASPSASPRDVPSPPPSPRRAAVFPLRARVMSPPPPPPPAALRSPFDKSTPAVPLNYAQTSYASIGNLPLPKRIKDVRPVHPPIAVWAGVNGTVLVEATIDETGRVT